MKIETEFHKAQEFYETAAKAKVVLIYRNPIAEKNEERRVARGLLGARPAEELALALAYGEPRHSPRASAFQRYAQRKQIRCARLVPSSRSQDGRDSGLRTISQIVTLHENIAQSVDSFLQNPATQQVVVVKDLPTVQERVVIWDADGDMGFRSHLERSVVYPEVLIRERTTDSILLVSVGKNKEPGHFFAFDRAPGLLGRYTLWLDLKMPFPESPNHAAFVRKQSVLDKRSVKKDKPDKIPIKGRTLS